MSDTPEKPDPKSGQTPAAELPCPKLTELQVAKLDAANWELEAQILRYEKARDAAAAAARLVEEVKQRFITAAESYGIKAKDVDFSWTPDGTVTYRGEDGKPARK